MHPSAAYILRRQIEEADLGVISKRVGARVIYYWVKHPEVLQEAVA
ncbi:MAG: hypothetical protein WCJ66_18730 [Verrucomicrobiota bacterium]